ncbi:gluconate transporter [Planosporangium thailandense]|uniref:Gluconate transporter n=1 Tax=Planosporangium thailandense TaxID=765197 RepID=A0ABX0XSS8_9ACTN|nr:gluconate:H+ symporter [Planosporangium thailandense]NJC68500.1 gluconate transporter [Planosporangium thailandense]
MHWTAHDTSLVVWAFIGIAVVVVLITQFKVHPFISLILGSGVSGLGAGLSAADVIKNFESGFGSTLGGVGILVALGTMLGKLLADSGGADRIVDTIVSRTSQRRLPWAMTLIAMIVGIPLFFEIGVVLLIPVIFLVARRARTSVVRVGIPALAGLSVMHGLVPPHPGPLIAISALHANLGQTMAYGLIVAIPTVIIAGPLYGGWIGRRVRPAPPERLVAQFAGDSAATGATTAAATATRMDAESDTGARTATKTAPVTEVAVDRRPSFGVALGTVLLPVVLMLGKALVDVLLAKTSGVRTVLDFLGDPFVALLLAVLVAMVTFGYLRGFSRQKVNELLGLSLAPIAAIVMIIGAGGGFKQILVSIGIGTSLGKAAAASHLSALALGWLIAVGIRLATGSATVATVTASGLMAPLVEHLTHVNRPLLALAIGSGSLFLSHVNDAGFWLVKEYFGMSVGQTFKTWSAMETILSVVSFVLILGLGAVV